MQRSYSTNKHVWIICIPAGGLAAAPQGSAAPAGDHGSSEAAVLCTQCRKSIYFLYAAITNNNIFPYSMSKKSYPIYTEYSLFTNGQNSLVIQTEKEFSSERLLEFQNVLSLGTQLNWKQEQFSFSKRRRDAFPAAEQGCQSWGQQGHPEHSSCPQP